MHIDLIELFRCPRPHEESWLVASFDRMAGRHVVEGRLGCPICRAEFPIERGVLRFDVEEAETASSPPPIRGSPGKGAVGLAGAVHATGTDDDEPLRLAAMLGLMGPGGVVVLSGSCGRSAAKIALLTEDVHLLLHDSAWSPGGEDTGTISTIASPGRLPLAPEGVRGVALDASGADQPLLDDAVRTLRAKGRLVAPVGTALPEGVSELARDDMVWVAERRPVPALVSLGRSGGR